MISSILLAAGLSSRMGGENKLSKEINGLPLINHAIKNILGSAVNEIVVVLGYDKNVIKNIIKNNKKIKFCYNTDYESGISSSIKVGLNNISKKTEAFFICLGDMPDVNQSIYNKLIKTRYNYNKKLKLEYKKEIIIPTYEGKSGNPVLFSKFIRNQIMSISGDDGAKKIIELNKKKILYVPLKSSGISLDFDTQEDFSE
jgi:molybdenum cofactor cytidylyltransferase